MNKKLIFSIFLLGFVCLASFVSAQVQIPNPICGGNPNCTLGDIVKNLVKGLGEIIVAISSVIIVYAGFLFIFSAGRPEKINQAKTTILYAAIGMFVGILATAIADTIKNILGA